MKSLQSNLCIFLLIFSLVGHTQENNIDSDMDMTVKMDHSHMPITVPKHAKPISLSLMLKKDFMSGYNLQLKTKHYFLTPPPSGVDMTELMTVTINNELGVIEGHAHLYVNGEKIQRIYGKNVHLPQTLFKQGTNSISVTLNNHGHMYWTIDDKKIVSTLYIDSSTTTELVKHKFESFPSI